MAKFRLDDQVSLVTGGANGIGAELAEALASAGSAVAILDLDLGKGERVPHRLAIECGVRIEDAVGVYDTVRDAPLSMGGTVFAWG